MIRILICLVWYLPCLAQTKGPEASISNGLITAKIYLPDSVNGYYTGSRFDWSGIIYSLRYKGHEFFGKWSNEYNDTSRYAMVGPAQAFLPLGFEEATAGGRFVNIGVGSLLKPDQKAYVRYKSTYILANGGEWKVKFGRDSIQFRQILHDAQFPYEYTKTLCLLPGKAELVITHTLRNTGSRPIVTEAFQHNFFMIDNEPAGPAYEVQFSFPAAFEQGQADERVAVSGAKLFFKKKLVTDETLKCALSGYGNNGYGFNLVNTASGAGVKVSGDSRLSQFVFWAAEKAVCPEPYIRIEAAPAAECRWTTTYQFFVQEKPTPK